MRSSARLIRLSAAVICAVPLLIGARPVLGQTAAAKEPLVSECGDDCIKISTKASLVHIGSLDSYDVTEGGKRAALMLMAAIQGNDKDAAAVALKTYQKLIPDENFGGEYTALAWFCEYLIADDAARKAMVTDPLVADYLRMFSENNWAVLKEYMMRKYRIERIQESDPEAGQNRYRFLEDFILFNNPRRESWEKSSKIVEVLGLKPGMSVADIGSGPGYYAAKFAELVGKDGKVYAIDINKDHIDYLKGYLKKNPTDQIVSIESKMNNILLAEQVDVAFLCSLWHAVYAYSFERVKDEFVQSIKDALKPDGRLVIADNALVEDTSLPYHGPYIAKELIIAQLKGYGFKLVEKHQFIPQRYVLVFKKI